MLLLWLLLLLLLHLLLSLLPSCFCSYSFFCALALIPAFALALGFAFALAPDPLMQIRFLKGRDDFGRIRPKAFLVNKWGKGLPGGTRRNSI